MTAERPILVASAVLALAGIGFFAYMLLSPHARAPAPKGSGPAVSQAGQEALRRSQPAPVRAEDAELVRERMAESLRAAARSMEAPHRLDADRLESLVRLTLRWISLHLDPDFESYRRFVLDLTGKDPAAPDYAFKPSSQSDLEASLREIRVCAIDEQSVEVRAQCRGGRALLRMPDGVRVSRTDTGGKYSRVGSDPPPPSLWADVYEVRVPVEAVIRDEPPPRRLFLTLSCVWLPSDPRWLPWQVAVEDPDAPRRALPVPWL